MPEPKKPGHLPEDNQEAIPQPSPGYTPSPHPQPEEENAQNPPNATPGEARAPSPPPPPLSQSEARTWGMLAHLSVLLNLVTGFLGLVAALIIYFAYRDRSRWVAYHAMQAFIFQAITWVGAGIVSGFLIGIGAGLSFLIIPLLCLIPGSLILLLPPISLIYGIIGGVKVNNGEDFRYWQVGDWVRDIIEPKPLV